MAFFISYTNSVERTEYNGESKRDMRERGKLVGNSFIHSFTHSLFNKYLLTTCKLHLNFEQLGG